MVTETRAQLEMLSEMWDDLKELERKISTLYVYIYNKELERQSAERQIADSLRLAGKVNTEL